MIYDRLVFLPNHCDMAVEKLAALFSETFRADQEAQVSLDGICVVARWDVWSLRAFYEAGYHVLAESRDIAALYAAHRKDQNTLATCGKRITITADDDYEMKHINHFAHILADLEEKFPGAVLFVPADGAFYDIGHFN